MGHTKPGVAGWGSSSVSGISPTCLCSHMSHSSKACQLLISCLGQIFRRKGLSSFDFLACLLWEWHMSCPPCWSHPAVRPSREDPGKQQWWQSRQLLNSHRFHLVLYTVPSGPLRFLQTLAWVTVPPPNCHSVQTPRRFPCLYSLSLWLECLIGNIYLLGQMYPYLFAGDKSNHLKCVDLPEPKFFMPQTHRFMQ